MYLQLFYKKYFWKYLNFVEQRSWELSLLYFITAVLDLKFSNHFGALFGDYSSSMTSEVKIFRGLQKIESGLYMGNSVSTMCNFGLDLHRYGPNLEKTFIYWSLTEINIAFLKPLRYGLIWCRRICTKFHPNKKEYTKFVELSKI